MTGEKKASGEVEPGCMGYLGEHALSIAAEHIIPEEMREIVEVVEVRYVIRDPSVGQWGSGAT